MQAGYHSVVRLRLAGSLPAATVGLGASLWLLLLVAAPYLATHAPVTDVRFRLADLMYLAAHSLCHQRPERSFHAWGLQFPVCARCLGLYASAAAGAVGAAIVTAISAGSFEARRRAAEGRVLVAAALPSMLSVALEVAGAWTQTPTVRFIAALPLGLAVGAFVACHAGEVAQAVRVRSRSGR